MSTLARLLSACFASACCAGAAAAAPDAAAAAASTAIDADRSCLSARWQQSGDAGDITVSADNRCGRALACDVHLSLRSRAGPDLYLSCMDQRVGTASTDTLCKWPGQPLAPGGGGSIRCRQPER